MAIKLTSSQMYLITALGADQSRLNLLEDYYVGNAPLPEGAKGASAAYRNFQKKARTNLAQLAVSATRERMIIDGFRTGADGDANGDAEARRLWKANNLGVGSADLHNMLLTFGEAYAIVGPPNAFGIPIATVEDPRQVKAVTDPMDPRVVLQAAKMWRDEFAGNDVVYFYTNDRIEVFVRPIAEDFYSLEGWVHDENKSSDNPIGEVPVVKFTNIDGRGEFEPFLDNLDRINHMILQRLVIATTAAFKQKWIAGDFPQVDKDGNQINYDGIFEPSAGALWMLPEGATLGESSQTDLSGILNAVRADIQDFAALTRTPMHYLSPDGANQSAEGASLAREGLVFKAEDRIARVTPSWSKVMSLMFKWLEDDVRASLLDLEPIWKPAERYSLAERADANSKYQDIPFRIRMTSIGQFSPEEVAEMEAERAGESLLQKALLGDVANAQSADKQLSGSI